MKKHQKWTVRVIIFSVLLTIGTMFTNYVIDPLQYYHKAFYLSSYDYPQRYQLPGLVRNYNYDTIVVGSSMSENFLPSYIKETLGYDAMKVAMSGGLPKEQYLITKLALETGKVKRVIWGIDYFALREPPDRVREDQGPFPYYLYDHNPFNKIQYLLNMDTTTDSFHIIVNRLQDGEVKEPDLNLANTWIDPALFGREKVLNHWEGMNKYEVSVDQQKELAYMEANIEDNMLSLIEAYPDVEFYLFYPPYSILLHYFYYLSNPQLLDNELYIKAYLFEKVKDMAHVQIYDFQQDEQITFNLDYYKDLSHHSIEVNEKIIDAIAAGEYLITEYNLHEQLDLLKQQVETLDPKEL